MRCVDHCVPFGTWSGEKKEFFALSILRTGKPSLAYLISSRPLGHHSLGSSGIWEAQYKGQAI